jgi:hypothetical protein
MPCGYRAAVPPKKSKIKNATKINKRTQRCQSISVLSRAPGIPSREFCHRYSPERNNSFNSGFRSIDRGLLWRVRFLCAAGAPRKKKKGST